MDENIELFKIEFGESLIQNLLNELYNRGITSLFVEGGETLLNAFIIQNHWDEARVFTGNKYFIEGILAPNIAGTMIAKEQLGDNFLSIIKRG